MKNKYPFIGIAFVVIFLVAIIYSLFIRPQYYKFNGGEAFLSPQSTQRFSDNYTQMTVIDNYIYECNKNGLVKRNVKGENVWSKGFFIETPYMVTEGEYIAVGDITGKIVNLFNSDGFQFEIKESWPIIDIHVNEHGFLTTVLENNTQNIINYYNNEGELVVTRGTRFIENGYPISVATSNDVTKMVTAYLNVSNNRLQTHISFFGFEDQYDKYKERIIGGFEYDNALASKVYWMDDTSVIVVLDNSIQIYDVKKEPKLINTISLYAELKKVVTTKNEIIVLYGNAIEENELHQENSLCVYSTEGKLLTKQTFEEAIQSVVANEESYFVITTSKVIKFKGNKRIWFAQTYLEIDDFYELNESEYLAKNERGYEILKIREK